MIPELYVYFWPREGFKHSAHLLGHAFCDQCIKKLLLPYHEKGSAVDKSCTCSLQIRKFIHFGEIRPFRWGPKRILHFAFWKFTELRLKFIWIFLKFVQFAWDRFFSKTNPKTSGPSGHGGHGPRWQPCWGQAPGGTCSSKRPFSPFKHRVNATQWCIVSV
jgi:hypothetical protein